MSTKDPEQEKTEDSDVKTKSNSPEANGIGHDSAAFSLDPTACEFTPKMTAAKTPFDERDILMSLVCDFFFNVQPDIVPLFISLLTNCCLRNQ